MPSARSVREHEGRVPQVGVPAGPRNSRSVKPPSRSGGTSGKLKVKGYVPKTPTVAYDPSAPPTAVQKAIRKEAKAKHARVVAFVASAPKKRSQSVKPKLFRGKKTAGTPTLGELKTAAASGALKVNKAGAVTTPKVRQASRALKVAKVKVQRSTGLKAPLAPQQRKFVKGVAKRTGESPRAVAAQALAEQSGPAAQAYEAQGEHNYLNIGPGVHFGTNGEAVKATANLLNTSSNYAGIRATRGKSPLAQVRAIGDSPWGTNKAVMEGTLREVGQKRNPKAVKRLRAAEAQAKEAGLNPKSVGAPSRQVVTRYKAGRSAMEQLDRGNNAGKLPYVWGGHHGNDDSFDCSGAVSYALDKMGVLKGSLVSGEMGKVLKPGPGAITVFYNGEHTFIYDAVKHEYWGTSDSNVGGGPGYFPKSVGDAEVAEGNAAGAYNVGHVPGLGKKQALQLGGSAAGISGSSFPGMTLAPSGTTATINSGAGATVKQPGYSKKPIKLTAPERVAKAEAKLKSLSSSHEAPSTEVLARLEQKYGSG